MCVFINDAPDVPKGPLLHDLQVLVRFAINTHRGEPPPGRPVGIHMFKQIITLISSGLCILNNIGWCTRWCAAFVQSTQHRPHPGSRLRAPPSPDHDPPSNTCLTPPLLCPTNSQPHVWNHVASCSPHPVPRHAPLFNTCLTPSRPLVYTRPWRGSSPSAAQLPPDTKRCLTLV